jgi:hypothetical protein
MYHVNCMCLHCLLDTWIIAHHQSKLVFWLHSCTSPAAKSSVRQLTPLDLCVSLDGCHFGMVWPIGSGIGWASLKCNTCRVDRVWWLQIGEARAVATPRGILHGSQHALGL